MMRFRNIPKRIFQSRPGLFPCQTETAIRRPPDALDKIRHFRQLRVQLNRHGIEDIVIADHHLPLSHSCGQAVYTTLSAFKSSTFGLSRKNTPRHRSKSHVYQFTN